MKLKNIALMLCIAGASILFGRHVVPAPKYPKTVEEVLAHIRSPYYPQPCFFNHIPAIVAKNTEDEIYASNTQDQHDLVPVGFSKGDVIPENCFAVQTGLSGVIVEYWQQPYWGLKMPRWNEIDQADLPE